jgi:hypothetical protein
MDAWGEPWLVFCHEWIQVEDGRMCAVRLSDDLRRPIGDPVELFRASAAAWSRPFAARGRQANRITDGPYLVRSTAGILHMLWSSMGADGYAMGCSSSVTGCILGPWQHSDEAVFAKDGGHGMIFQTFDGRAMMTLHRPNTSPDERPHWLPISIPDEGILIGQLH